MLGASPQSRCSAGRGTPPRVTAEGGLQGLPASMLSCSRSVLFSLSAHTSPGAEVRYDVTFGSITRSAVAGAPQSCGADKFSLVIAHVALARMWAVMQRPERGSYCVPHFARRRVAFESVRGAALVPR